MRRYARRVHTPQTPVHPNARSAAPDSFRKRKVKASARLALRVISALTRQCPRPPRVPKVSISRIHRHHRAGLVMKANTRTKKAKPGVCSALKATTVRKSPCPRRLRVREDHASPLLAKHHVFHATVEAFKTRKGRRNVRTVAQDRFAPPALRQRPFAQSGRIARPTLPFRPASPAGITPWA